MREGDNGERLLKIGSIPLLIPTSIEKQVSVGDEEEEGKEDEEHVCVGIQAERELKVYTRRKMQKEGNMNTSAMPLVPSSPMSDLTRLLKYLEKSQTQKSPVI